MKVASMIFILLCLMCSLETNAQISDVVPTTIQETNTDFIVIKSVEGDTIHSIAVQFGILPLKLAEYNKISSASSQLKINSEIKIPITSKLAARLKKADKVISDSGEFFKEGLLSMKDYRRSDAGNQFDKSVEVFLMSGFNVSRNAKLQDCYTQLIETVYQIEFPADKNLAQKIRTLSAMCNWNWNDNDYKLSDTIAKNVLADGSAANENLIATVKSDNQTLPEGFNKQKFEASPLDELAKLELIPEEIQSVSERTGVSVKELQAVNGNEVRIVKAQNGDTVAKIAARYGASVVEVAKFNGLLPNTALAAGREIKIPAGSKIKLSIVPTIVQPLIVQNKPPIDYDIKSLGPKPAQTKDGKVQAVMDYFDENYDDPYSMRFVRWSLIEKRYYKNISYWAVQVKFRAKNAFGAYVLTEKVFYIKNNKVIANEKIY